jgi:hypothetical protein
MRSDDLAYWIISREQMRLTKEIEDITGARVQRAYGYSNDPHMGLVRYCNVRREDDKVTKWLAEHWRPNHHAVWEIVLARMINYIPSLERVLNSWGPVPSIATASDKLKKIRDFGGKVFTSAYTISTCGRSMDKIDYVMGVVLDAKTRFSHQWQDNFFSEGTLAEAHRLITQINGLGSFLAAQVIADLKNTKGHPLQDAPDWHTWAAPGPGSLRGLSAYFGTAVTPSMFTSKITECWGEVRPKLPSNLQDLHMQDFQNCLCEFSKYVRVRGGGHARNNYTPGENK